jgi:membrane protein YqaA with SNARE-associated domain
VTGTISEILLSEAVFVVLLIVLVAWSFAEAVLLPVVPDVLLGLIALLTPWLLPQALAATIGGALAGATVLWWLLARRPRRVEAMLAALPALGHHGLAEAAERIRSRGALAGFVQLGAGLPLKAYLHALARVEPGRGRMQVAGLTVVNRVTRLLPVSLGFAILHPLVEQLDPDAAPLLVIYVAGWIIFYLAYWWWMAPSRGGRRERATSGTVSVATRQR